MVVKIERTVTKKIVCNICGSEEGVVRYRITRTEDRRGGNVDMCSEHGAPLEEALGTLSVRPVRGRTVTPMSAIKKTAKKTAKRSTGKPRRS